MSVIIYTDSTCDCKNEWYEKMNVTMIPLTYLIEDEEFVDNVEKEDLMTFYEKMINGAMPKTSAINTETFISSWTPHLENGNDIVYTGLAKKLSATCGNAETAAEILKEKFPDRDIIVLDSKNTTAGLTDIITRLCEYRDQGLSAKEIGEKLAEIREHYEGWVCVNDLAHLRKGGRISGASAAIGSILNIKPIILLNHEGALDVVSKVKGDKKAVKLFIDKLKENAADPVNDPIWVAHCYSDEMANNVIDAIKNEFNNKNIFVKHVGGVISSHTGPYTTAIFFRSK